jgi:hypothetical protein
MSFSTTHELARELLAREPAGHPPSAAAAAEAAERTLQRLADSLGRWLGPDGSQALLTRALSLAQTRNDALKAVPPPARSALFLDALAARAEPHDAQSVADGAMTILVTLIDLLTRLIGHDLAVRLVAESTPHEIGEGAFPPGSRSQP